MTDGNCSRFPSEAGSSAAKKRKKRNWDQPDESLVSTHVSTNIRSLAGVALPSVSSSTCASAVSFPTAGATSLQGVQVPLQQYAVTVVQNLVQSRMQDELISREIIINDADSAVRYKLTKRQMQEEIQKCTGAVVITRGKYRPPNSPPDGERPLYLHISAASHLETTAKRIKAVDQAAIMIEEMLKQGQVDRLSSTCVFLGFEADPSMNIISRIRGPNDQYVNHIMNETGATVSLRGRGSGHPLTESTEETQQSLHLLISSDDLKSLEHAKVLAENLLDTISAECGAFRGLSCNSYSAVPPPSKLMTELQSPLNSFTSCSTSLAVVSIVDTNFTIPQSVGAENPGLPQANSGCYPHASLINGTSYIGYGGIYPQATPLQQVALALKQSTSPVSSTAVPATTSASTEPPLEVPIFEKDKRPQKRKFQELPADAKRLASINQKNFQRSEFPMPRELTSHVGGSGNLAVPRPPKNSVQPSFGGMPPPPPPPEFNSSPKLLTKISPPRLFNSNPNSNGSKIVVLKSKPEAVPDTLIRLTEYGDDDDDDDGDNDEDNDNKDDDDDDDNNDLEETAENPAKNNPSAATLSKPFWAV